MIINDIDPGGAHPFPAPQGGQTIGSALIEGSRTVIWPRGGIAEQQSVTFWATAWQGAGGQAAGSYLALRYLLRQLEELALNPDMQPVYIQWAATAQSGQYNVSTPHDGWYLISDVEPDYENFVVGGMVKVKLTASRVGPGPPGALRMLFLGSALASTYTATPVALLSYPVAASQIGPGAFSRTGGEGAVPLTAAPMLNPVPFVPPSIANLYLGGVRCYDSITAGGNAVPAAPGYANATWVQIYGAAHDLTGDLIITNGLLLLRFNQGGTGCPSVYVWNTSLGTPGWQLVGELQYKDSAFNVGSIRAVDLDWVGRLESQVRVRSATSAGQWAELRIALQAGADHASVEFEPLTQANSVAYGLDFIYQTAVKVIANESVPYDIATQGTANLAPSAGAGWAVGISQTGNQPLVGLLWQNPPNAGQPGAGSTTDIGFGETTGPAQGTFRTYGLFAVPWVTSPNLLAEAESGTLDSGWTSAADAGSSGGNAAKCASGTVSGRADKWGAASFVPTPGLYLPAWRGRVTSAAGTTAEMTVGLWDDTSAAFVALASTTYRANQITTGYLWYYTSLRKVTDGVTNGTTTVTSATAHFTSADVGKAISGGSIPAGATISSITNATTVVISAAATASASGLTLTIGAAVTPTATHNMRMRAVTAATLGTDYWADQHALIPIQSASLGAGNFPADIWAQFAGRRTLQLMAG